MNVLQQIQSILKKDKRYALEGYFFVLEAVNYTRKKFRKTKHVTGQELLEGIKELALVHYGAMAKVVFEHWGISRTVDFGYMVFNMVNEGVLSKTEEDSLSDFQNVYDFDAVFVKNYVFTIKERKHGK